MEETDHHSQSNLLTTILLLYCIIQHNVQENLVHPLAYSSFISPRKTHIVTSQHPNNLPASIQLHKEPFVEVLHYHISPFILPWLLTYAVLELRLSRASSCAILGATVRVEGSQTYLLELWLSLRHLDGRFEVSFVRGSPSIASC